MADKKLVLVQIGSGTGAKTRAVTEDMAPELLKNQEKVVRYFVEKGFPRDMVEKQFAARLLGPADTQTTLTDSTDL